MDEDFRTHLEHVTAARAELGDSMRALQDAPRTPAGAPGLGRRVRAALTELAHDLREHVALTESPGGLYADIGATAPRLATGWTPNWLTMCSSSTKWSACSRSGTTAYRGRVGSTPRGADRPAVAVGHPPPAWVGP